MLAVLCVCFCSGLKIALSLKGFAEKIARDWFQLGSKRLALLLVLASSAAQRGTTTAGVDDGLMRPWVALFVVGDSSFSDDRLNLGPTDGSVRALMPF